MTVGELALGVAHDIGNNLAVIRACAAHVLAGDALDPGGRDAIQDLALAAERSIDLTKRVLGFARGSSHRRALIQLDALLAETVSLLQRAVGGGVEILLQLEARAPVVAGDPADLQNAFLNLGLNARDAMPGGGAVVISTHAVKLKGATAGALAAGPYVRVAVADKGIGIPTAHLGRVFEPFFTTKPGGTGLGLWIVGEVVARHGGGVEVVSDVDAGTTVAVLLPLAGSADRRARRRPQRRDRGERP